MNRRITIFDQEDFKTNHLLWWSLPLGNEIYSIQILETMPIEQKEAVLNIGEGDGVLVASGNAWSMLRERYHFGVRNEGFVDCQQLTRLSIEGGAYLKCIPAGEFPEDQVISAFMSPDFTKKVEFGWFKQKVLHTVEDAHRFLGWLEQQPDNTHFGYDVESSGMAIDRWFELSGLSICTAQYGGFISLTDIRHQVGKESAAYLELMARIGQFLENRMDHIWVYNMQYEFQVSFRMFHKDLYNLCDAGVTNILDGYHLNKKYSLKWTAQRILGCEVWDSAFDRISELIEEMLFTEIGKTKAERQKILKVDQTNFKNSPEWAKLVNMYPGYKKEFEQLILEYWGNAFMCVPSEILGYYCNLDAFYTLMIYMARKDSYTEKTFNVFMDNLRLACRLHSTGIPKDEKYRLQYESFNEDMMTIGITNCARARCWIKMEKHKAKMANINKYSQICRQLLESNKFFNGDPIAITKDLLISNLDCFDCTETGLDEGKLALMYGDSMAGNIVQIVKDAMVEVKMKTKIDETIVRKKKIIGIIAEKLTPLFGLDKVKIGPKHIELEKYLYYERAYKELTKVAQKQLGDPNNIPKEIYAFGSKKTRTEYCEHVSDNYFKCASPIENDEIILEMAQLFSGEASFLASLRDSTQQLPENTDFYKNLGIGSIEDAYDHFQKNFTDVWNGKPCEQTDYGIQKIFELAYKYVRDLKCDPIKETLSSFDGYQTIENFFPDVRNRYTEFEKPFDPSDLENRFGFLLKYMLNYLLYKKNAKILSTYIQGMFKKEEKYVIEDPATHIIIREADPLTEPEGVYKLLIHFACMEKSSKRWSSGFHTIVSKSDIKSTLIAYGYGSGYGYETIGKPQQGELLSYFDMRNCVA